MKSICKNSAFLIQGKYYLYNNLWGANTGSGSQCLWSSPSDPSHMAWGTSWNWTGQKNTIKSFAAAVWGWHWGWTDRQYRPADPANFLAKPTQYLEFQLDPYNIRGNQCHL